MSSTIRRGGIPGPESWTGLTRPSMTEAEFERRLNSTQAAGVEIGPSGEVNDGNPGADLEHAPRVAAVTSARSRSTRVKTAKPRRVQRMFAIEEDLDKKLWLYAIHLGKDRSEVVNDLLRPIVASMVLYDSRDRRAGRSAEPALERATQTPIRMPELSQLGFNPRRGKSSLWDIRISKKELLTGPGACHGQSGFKHCQAQRLEHLLPTTQSRVICLNCSQNRFSLCFGQLLPGRTQLCFACFITLSLNLIASLLLNKL